MRHARFARRVNLSHPARLRRRANQWPQSARLVPTRGAYRDRHGRWARDAMDALLRETSAATRTAKSCGPDLPTLGSSLCVTSAQSTVAKKPGTPRRARISRQTNRAGNAGCFGVPVVTCLRAFLSCTQGCGCDRCTGIPCALLLLRDNDDASLGRICAAGMRSRVSRHCEERRVGKGAIAPCPPSTAMLAMVGTLAPELVELPPTCALCPPYAVFARIGCLKFESEEAA